MILVLKLEVFNQFDKHIHSCKQAFKKTFQMLLFMIIKPESFWAIINIRRKKTEN